MPAQRRYQEDPDNPLGIPGPGEPESQVPPIGVPPGYSTDVDISSYTDIFGNPWGTGSTVERKPTYYEGDELLGANFSPERIGELQKQMAELGLLPPGARPQYRVWDDITAAAFHTLLAYANQNGLHWTSALNKLKSETGGAYEVDENGNLVPAGAEEKELLPTRTTPTEELLPIFRQAVIEMRGEGWSDEQLQSMVSAYQQNEITKQREAYAAEGTEKNVEGMPSPEAFIMSKVEQADPGRVAAEKGLHFIDDFQNLLSQWSGA